MSSSHSQPLTTGSRNYENHNVITIFWRNCPGKWPHLLGSLRAFDIPKEKPSLQQFYQGKYELYLTIQDICFFLFICDVFRVCPYSIQFNFYMIFVHFILKKIKRTLLKKDKYIDRPTFDYPLFPRISILKINSMPYLQKCTESTWFILIP